MELESNKKKSVSDKKNISYRAAPQAWNAADVHASLQHLQEYVQAEAQAAIDWYFRKKASKAFCSRWLRFFAIALTSIAGILPILMSLLGWKIPDGLLVSLLLGSAASMVGLDHFFGFSSGWIRYVVTATGMQGALEEFRMDWQIMKARLSSPPSNDQILALLERAKRFRATIGNMVLDETMAWAAEFQTSLAQLEKDIKAEFARQQTKLKEDLEARREASRPGGIELIVWNALTADDRTFLVEMEGLTEKLPSETVLGGMKYSKSNLTPGPYTLVVRARRSGKEVRVSRIVKIEPGQVVIVEADLPE